MNITTQQILNEWFIEERTRQEHEIMSRVFREWDSGEHPTCHFHQFVTVRFIELWLEWVQRN